jgi:hypothetical protein
VQKRYSESYEATKKRLYRERKLWTDDWLWITCQDKLPPAERLDRIAEWERSTGQKWLTEAKRLALNAWYRENGVIRPWRYPKPRRHHWRRRRLPLPIGGGPQTVKLAAQLTREHCGDAGSSLLEDLVALSAHAVADWGRYERIVRLKDGSLSRVAGARAARPARSIRFGTGLNRRYRGRLAREWQRLCQRQPGDWAQYKWDAPELSTWRFKVNRGFFKLPIPGNADPTVFAPVRGHPLDRPPAPLLFNQVLRGLDSDVLKECADALDTDRNLDGVKLRSPLPYNPQGRRAVLEFFSDDSISVHWECEKRNRGRMRGGIPFNSTTKACSGIVGYIQPSPGWAARPPIPNRVVALAVLRSGKLPPIERVNAYWQNRLRTLAVEIEARALTAKCEVLRPLRAFCEMVPKERCWYTDPRIILG